MPSQLDLSDDELERELRALPQRRRRRRLILGVLGMIPLFAFALGLGLGGWRSRSAKSDLVVTPPTSPPGGTGAAPGVRDPGPLPPASAVTEDLFSLRAGIDLQKIGSWQRTPGGVGSSNIEDSPGPERCARLTFFVPPANSESQQRGDTEVGHYFLLDEARATAMEDGRERRWLLLRAMTLSSLKQHFELHFKRGGKVYVYDLSPERFGSSFKDVPIYLGNPVSIRDRNPQERTAEGWRSELVFVHFNTDTKVSVEGSLFLSSIGLATRP